VRPDERRAQIKRIALELFAERGYHGTQISDLIEGAQIARGTFYLYFRNKREIFDELLDDLLRTIDGCIRGIEVGEGAEPVHDQMRGNLTRVLETVAANRAIARILLRAAVGLDPDVDRKVDDFHRQVTNRISEGISEGMEKGIVRPCDPHVVGVAILGMIKEVVYQYLVASDGEPDWDQVTAEVLAVVTLSVLGTLPHHPTS
jgi:AcrR family transcriptional regulator